MMKQKEDVSLYLAQPREFTSELSKLTTLLNNRKETVYRKLADCQRELAQFQQLRDHLNFHQHQLYPQQQPPQPSSFQHHSQMQYHHQQQQQQQPISAIPPQQPLYYHHHHQEGSLLESKDQQHQISMLTNDGPQQELSPLLSECRYPLTHHPFDNIDVSSAAYVAAGGGALNNQSDKLLVAGKLIKEECPATRDAAEEKGAEKDFGDDIYQIESLQRHLAEAAKNNSDLIF